MGASAVQLRQLRRLAVKALIWLALGALLGACADLAPLPTLAVLPTAIPTSAPGATEPAAGESGSPEQPTTPGVDTLTPAPATPGSGESTVGPTAPGQTASPLGPTAASTAPAASASPGSSATVPTGTGLRSPTPTPTVAAATPTPECAGDCRRDGMVTVDELLIMVNIALGAVPTSTCLVGDANQSGEITVDEILVAVNHALSGCVPP